ncbi:MAG: hypothetical protein LCH32_06935 [Bacteroidetes bacterium]|nr:hypothetical protein [Bacteroidota bacterium]
MKIIVYIFLFIYSLQIFSQKDSTYFRKEEIIYDGKLYRKHNNYLTFGPGYSSSTIRTDLQKDLGIDFNFHIRKIYFQTGVNMSGNQFLSNNNINIVFGVGLRKENHKNNFAIYAGPTYYTGVIGIEDSLGIRPQFYSGAGAYISAQAIIKLTYDIGFGIQPYATINTKQIQAGIKAVLFFSGSYRGPKRNYNPNVRQYK